MSKSSLVSVLWNPLRSFLLWIGLALSRAGLVSESRVRRTVELSWPRIVTGLARMSKGAADLAMVGIALGPTAIAGIGFASPYWGLTFSIGSGLAAATISLVSQRYSAGAFDELERSIRSSVLLVLAVSVPIAVVFWMIPTQLIDLLSDDPVAIEYGAEYLSVLALGVPFAALNLIGSRSLIGVDDAWTPMILRSGGAVMNILLNGIFIFALGMGVRGAALGTVLANVLVTGAFAVGFATGRLPGLGAFPVSISPFGSYRNPEISRDLVTIGLPVIGRNSVWMVARFPLLAFVGLFGSDVVAAYVIARRIRGLMNTPGWGFGLAASSLVGQALGEDDEDTAASYGREITLFSVVTYAIGAVFTVVFAEQIVALFVGESGAATVPIATMFVYMAAIAVLPQGVSSAISGALDATGDTRWPFYSRILGMFGFAIPLVYLGATTSLGLVGIYLSFIGETLAPAAINYYRFNTGAWKTISRGYRPEQRSASD